MYVSMNLVFFYVSVSYAIANIEGSLQFIMNVPIPDLIQKKYFSSEFYGSIVGSTLTLSHAASGTNSRTTDIQIPDAGAGEDSPFGRYTYIRRYIDT